MSSHEYSNFPVWIIMRRHVQVCLHDISWIFKLRKILIFMKTSWVIWKFMKWRHWVWIFKRCNLWHFIYSYHDHGKFEFSWNIISYSPWSNLLNIQIYHVISWIFKLPMVSPTELSSDLIFSFKFSQDFKALRKHRTP